MICTAWVNDESLLRGAARSVRGRRRGILRNPDKERKKHELSARLPQHCTGGGALDNHADPAIKTREDFEKYPFDKVPALYAERFGPQFDALRAHMPEGMKAIGGIAIGSGNSIPDYVDVNKYVLMTRTVRECRGDKL